MKKFLLIIVLAIVIFPFLAGCEERYEDDWAEYVTVSVDSKTAWVVDVYVGDAFEERLEPGEYGYYSEALYPGEKIRLKFIIWRPGDPKEIRTEFDDDFRNYHVNIYNDWIETY